MSDEVKRALKNENKHRNQSVRRYPLYTNMRNSLPTVAVGIPAYNEAGNIGFLIEDLLRQKTESFRLEQILILSDGSSDGTVAIARSYQDERIKVVDNQDRKGKAARQNQIFETVESDILVMLDADVLLYRNNFLEELVAPILEEDADLVAAKIEPLKPKTWVERGLFASVLVKNRAFEMFRGGNNIFTCAGVGRAFSRRFYPMLRFTDSVGEDAYSYLYCTSYGLTYRYAPKAVLGIRLPDNIRDHARQSYRYQDSQKRFAEEFGIFFVQKEYALPKPLLMQAVAFVGIIKPFSLSFYFLFMAFLSLRKMLRVAEATDTWEVAESSKVLRSS